MIHKSATALFSAVLLAGWADLSAQTTSRDPGFMGFEATVTPPPPGEYQRHLRNRVEVAGLPSHAVRMAYIIPNNRTAQPNAVEKIRASALAWQQFYAEQMERNGFGPKTFALETEADNVTPKVWVVNAPQNDAYYRTDPWTRVAQAAQNAGLPVWSNGNMWILTYEAHVMNSDGSITGIFNGGGSFGSGSDGGVGMFNAYMITLQTDPDLVDNRNYDGLVYPAIGTHPMRYGKTQASYDGATVSSLSSVQFGVLWHEADHGFGRSHDFRHDTNFAGNLMGNGFRGVRGYRRSNLYSQDELRASYASCLANSVSRYFNSGSSFPENTKPTVTLHSSGGTTTVQGKLPVRFTASDSSGLAVALLLRNNEVLDEVRLTGTSVDHTFLTPHYTPSSPATWMVQVFDIHGNKQEVSASITPIFVVNVAPRPYFSVKPSSVFTGQTVELDARLTQDFDHSVASVEVEWDLDGDGNFDTVPTTNKVLTTTYATAGNRLIRVRAKDPAGAATVSTPIAIRVTEAPPAAVSRQDWKLYQ